MQISLTRAQILKALPMVGEGLGKYLYLQGLVGNGTDLSRDEVFQKKYNGFYKVRRNQEWRRHYFKIMEEQKLKKTEERLDFLNLLKTIHRWSGKAEASFASKLAATIDTSLPVIDRIVLKNIGAKLTGYKESSRIKDIAAMYKNMKQCYDKYLVSEDGRFLITEFKKLYPQANVSKVKMLDLVLWQTR